jgi:hypothetical protein
MAKVILNFDEEDNPVISVEGVRGKKCLEASRPYEEALGTVSKMEPTEEMDGKEKQVREQTITNR